MYGLIAVAIIEASVTALLIWLAVRRGASFQRSLVLIALPIPLLVCAAWGLIFWIPPGSASRADWVVNAIGVFAYGSIVVGAVVTLIAKGFRIPTAIFALLQVPATFFIAFLTIMEVTGNWI